MKCVQAFVILLLVQHAFFVTGQSKIKKIVVLMEENRSYDHMMGWYAGGNGLRGNESNLVNTLNATSQRVFVSQTGPEVNPCDPDHGTYATALKLWGMVDIKNNLTEIPSMCGFIEWENFRGNAPHQWCDVMAMQTLDQVPVMTSLASEFALMDRFFAAHPGPTWPNRLFALSATSAGSTETGTWFQGKQGQLFPQKTIYDQLTSEGFTWRNYFNDTPWELMLQSTAHNPEHLVSMEQFWVDAREGNLPDFSWINPRSGINVTLMEGSNDQHPDHDVSMGERYYKDIYEALRASPQWNETLFIITYDEHGGFFDHVPPPMHVPPPGDGYAAYPDTWYPFDRLGVRLPTILISPWIPKGLVVSEPPEEQKPFNNSEYTLTSIMATVRKLLGMKTGPLTKRDAWSATFEQVFNLSEPRTDCPMHLPDAAPPATAFAPEKEALLPINHLQEDIMTMHAHLAGVEYPHHVKHQGKMSEWAQEHFHKHKENVRKWKQSQVNPEYQLVVRATGNTGPGFVNGTAGSGWNVTKGTVVPFFTIALRRIPMCLNYGATPVAGAILNVTQCFPNSDPDMNRDPGQQWVWTGDSTIRPFVDQSLCLTNNLWNNDLNAYLQPCTGAVQQFWGYSGAAPGNGDSGSIYFGDAGALGVIPVNSTAPTTSAPISASKVSVL